MSNTLAITRSQRATLNVERGDTVAIRCPQSDEILATAEIVIFPYVPRSEQFRHAQIEGCGIVSGYTLDLVPTHTNSIVGNRMIHLDDFVISPLTSDEIAAIRDDEARALAARREARRVARVAADLARRDAEAAADAELAERLRSIVEGALPSNWHSGEDDGIGGWA